MPIDPKIISAIGGGGLTAADYAGLTPEQIQMVAGQGQKDRQIMLGTVMDMSQQELAERKQQNDEFMQNEQLKLMRRKEARDEFQTMHSVYMGNLEHVLKKKQIELDSLRTNAAVNADKKQLEVLDAQLKDLTRQREVVDGLRSREVVVPGLEGDDGKAVKMNMAELHSVGALDNVIAAGVAKLTGGTSGTSKQIQLREYIGGYAEKLGASPVVVDFIKMMGPEGLKGMTPAALHNRMLAEDTLYKMKAGSSDPAVRAEAKKILDAQFEFVNLIKAQAGMFLYDELGGDFSTPGETTGSDTTDNSERPRTVEDISAKARAELARRRAEEASKF